MSVALLVSAADYFTHPEITVAYLLPICVAAWYGGPKVGAVVAVYASAAVFVTGAFSHLSDFQPVEQTWSLLVRLAMFLFVAMLVGRLKDSRTVQKQLTEFIVHDLRSPISSSITGLQTLELMADGFDEDQREMVELALVSNQRALTLVNSMLDVAKLESGSMEVSTSPTMVDEMIEDCFNQVALWAQGEEIQLEPQVGLREIPLDRNLTTRVIVNLLSNALKYSPPKGKVTVKVSPWHGMARFEVTDRGPGIPPEFVPELFKPFSMAKGSKSGSGLGLAFCRLAVNAQGGKIWAESQVGKGTTMVFTLPLSIGQ